MKKVLFATTALIATAGVASADIAITGTADFGFKDTGVNGTDAYIHNEIDFNIVASTTTDAGYTIGASIDLDDQTGATAGSTGDQETYISGPFGTITVGDVDAAADGHGLADVGFDGLTIDDDVEAIRALGNADIKYNTTVGGVAVTLTYSMGTTAAGAATDGDYGVLVGFNQNGFGVTLGYDVDDSATVNDSRTSLGLTYSVGGVNLAGFFADNSTNSATGFSASYAIDANTTVTAVYGSTDVAGDKSDFGVGFSTNLGGGVKLAGGVGRADATAGTTTTVADLGFNIAF
ncbi:porin [Rhodobacterales bacterium LSUCC1028]|nr:porin [Rhodobacterales bacterium LSUCC1028]